jgi:hypothetical protein
VIDLNTTYQQLARPWSHRQLAARYRETKRRGEAALDDAPEIPAQPISLLAGAIPASANLSVAIHALHILPSSALARQGDRLLDVLENNVAAALHRCHRTLELDSRTYAYTPVDWLPIVYDTAASLLEAARLDREPPSLVQHAQEAVHWIASAIIDLDQNSPKTPEALADAIGRLLTLSTFADAARDLPGRHDD